MMDKYILFFDLDGTLLMTLDECYPGVIDMLKELKEKGHIVFASTGRGKNTIPKCIDNIVDGIITLTGASCFYQGKETNVHYFSDSFNEEFVKLIMNKKVPAFAENNEYLCSIGGQDEMTDMEKMMVDISDYHIGSIDQWEKSSIYNKVSKYSLTANNIDVFEEINEELKATLTLLDCNGGWYEITKREISKGNAIRDFLNKNSFNTLKTICFGDSENDLSMFDVCDVSVAVGEALDIVKSKADYVLKNPIDIRSFLIDMNVM